MKITVSAAISLDGYLDDCSPERLKLSSPEDWAAVERLRADCDVILVGAETVRRDNPSLVIRSQELRLKRIEAGMNPDIDKITLTRSGRLDPNAAFFTEGQGRKIVFASGHADFSALDKIYAAEVISLEDITASNIANCLETMGYRHLMVEGGSAVLTMFLQEGVVGELRLAVAPFFVGESGAPRFVGEGDFKWNKSNRMRLDSVERLGDMAVMIYKPLR